MLTTSIVIPIYKKHDVFLRNLKNNVQFTKSETYILVNDDPNSQIPLSEIPSTNAFSCIQNSQNLGFAKSVNLGVKEVTSDLVMLLNTDVALQDESWKNAISEFEKDQQLFAISFAQVEEGGNIIGRNDLYFSGGLFQHRSLPTSKLTAQSSVLSTNNSQLTTNNSQLFPTAWAEGGSAIFRKSMWDKLGGFDENFSPFYWEDIDLSYRAKEMGWKVYFASKILVNHEHESTIGAFYEQTIINSIAFKHQLYFTQKHADKIQKIFFYIFLLKSKIKGSFGK